MKAIVTVLGKDKVGIVAGVSRSLANFNLNIINVSQSIMEGLFTMTMLVDLSNISVPFEDIKFFLLKDGEKLGVKIKIQREEIFNEMHML